jgi:chloride channel protein, CIC family
MEQALKEAEPMDELQASAAGSSASSIVANAALAGLLGGSVAAVVVVSATELIKAMLDVVLRQDTWVLIVVPQIGLALSVLLLHGFGRSGHVGGPLGAHRSRLWSWLAPWRTFPPGSIRSDLTGDMVHYAGREEHFPWRLAPLRLLAIHATVGLGAAMGTEKPAAYLGVAAGAALGHRRWRRLLRPMAVAGGAAGVSVLMGIPLVGTAYILELERRHCPPLTPERLTAALVGGMVGWLWHMGLGVDLISLVVPRESPHSFYQALSTAMLIGLLSGVITSSTGEAIYRAKYWRAHPAIRLALGGLALAVAAVILAVLASPAAAVGPGTGAITWVESTQAGALTVLAVCLLRAVATTASSAVGGCGGLFVPFLGIGDLAGRVFAPLFAVPGDLAGAAGAASGISGGYHLPFTAVALLLGQGGPPLAVFTCLVAVLVATYTGTVTASLVDLALLRWPRPADGGEYTF